MRYKKYRSALHKSGNRVTKRRLNIIKKSERRRANLKRSHPKTYRKLYRK